jgi:hypothetical protein
MLPASTAATTIAIESKRSITLPKNGSHPHGFTT